MQNHCDFDESIAPHRGWRNSLLAVLIAVGLALAPSTSAAEAPSDGVVKREALDGITRDTIVIEDIENRPITFFVEHVSGQEERRPIVVVIDGSGCRGALRPGFSGLLRPSAELPFSYSKLTINKPGVDPALNEDVECGTEFRERFSIDSAVLDHLRVLQHLKAHADWWDGRLMIFGWSDGGDIGARLMSYYPNVERAVLGAQGGGYTMAEHMEDFWDCAADLNTPEEREECLVTMRGWFEELREKPLASLGKQDSNMLWRSRIFADLVPILADTTAPLLVVHGAEDRDNTPVESARRLVARLNEAARPALTYCEVPGMAHGHGSVTPEQQVAMERAYLEFLFDAPGVTDRLATFCDPDPDLTKTAPPRAES